MPTASSADRSSSRSAWRTSSASVSSSSRPCARSPGRTRASRSTRVRPREGGCRDRGRRAESRRGDSLPAGASGVAYAAPAGELAGQRYEDPRRLSRALLGRGRALGRGLRARTSSCASCTTTRRPRPRSASSARFSRASRPSSPGVLNPRAATRARPRGDGEIGRAVSAAGDGLHRDRLVRRGVDAGRVRLDVRHRRSYAVRAGSAPARRSDPLGVLGHRGFGHMHMEGAARSGEAPRQRCSLASRSPRRPAQRTRRPSSRSGPRAARTPRQSRKPDERR